MINYSHLKFPPLKYKQMKSLPDKLVYGKSYRYGNSIIDEFVMFSTKPDSNGTTTMRCVPKYIERDGQKYVPSLYIGFLFSSIPDHGFGTAMLNYAKAYSRQIGCGGRFHVYASSGLMPNRIPHPFYKKYGMNTGDTYIDNKLDKLIRKNKNAAWRDFDEMYMYYPPILPNKKYKKSILEVLKNFFRSSIKNKKADN